MYQKVLLTGKVVEILQEGTLIESKFTYTPKDGSTVQIHKVYTVLRDENEEYEVDHLVLVTGRLVPNAAGSPPVDGKKRPRFIVKARKNEVSVMGAYLDDLIDNDRFEIFLLGNCGKDAVTRTTKTGRTVVNLSVAVNVSLGVDGKEKCWFEMADWPKGEFSPLSSFKKGELVFVQGSLDFNPETGLPNFYQKEDGTIMGKFEIKFPYVLHLTPKNGNGGEHTDTPPPPDDDIPF